jgi:hypothetical protein
MAKVGAYPIVGPIIGYVCAVVSAALAFVLLTIFHGFAFQGELSTVYPISERIREIMLTVVVELLIITFATFFTAIIPVVVVHQIAKRFSVKSFWYYIACGALTGLALSSLAIAIGPPSFMEPAEIPPFFNRVLYFARFSVPSGAVGGLAYWIITGRFLRKTYWTSELQH